MTTSRLRDTFALLLREGHKQPAALSADAERTIRRRIGLRWAGRVGALVVAGALGTATVVAASGGWGGDSALPSPIVTPTIGVAKATFPVAGGPEFVSAAAGLRCGDPVPTQHSTDHDVLLSLTQGHVWNAGDAVESPDDGPSVTALLLQTSDTEMGVLATSGISLVVARDGLVVGVVGYSPTDTGWNLPGSGADGSGGYTTPLIAPWISCPGADGNGFYSRTGAGIEQGTYDIIAIARVFSTPESVALHQVLPGYLSAGGFDTGYLDPNAIYLPGSWDCAQAVAGGQPPRGCLPDDTDAAVYNQETSEITILYDPTQFVEEFSTVLVSQPLTVTIPGADALPRDWFGGPESLGVFDSIDDFTCGASASANRFEQGPGRDVSITSADNSVGPSIEGGPFAALALATGIPDGATLQLMPGARFVLLEYSEVAVPGADYTAGVQTVVGESGVTVDEPFTADRFAGPRPVEFSVEPLAGCPGKDATVIGRSGMPVLVGTWRIEAPDGTVTKLDTASSLWISYGVNG